MKLIKKSILTVAIFFAAFTLFSAVAPAAITHAAGEATEETAEETEEKEDNSKGAKAIAAGLAIGLAAGAGAIGMGLAVGKSNEGIARQPQAEGAIRTTMILGIIFIETAIIYALIVSILVIFVL
ncbi:MAG: ATP synthase F0 subunit C [Eubacterium sp.]|nr:ATP synthase F0 subunit C [Eubacterium sp.]